PPPQAPAPPPASAPAPPPSPAPVPAPVAAPVAAAPPANGGGAVTSPIVRQLIAQEGLDPAQIRATGEGGRITRNDVLQAARARGPAPAAPAPAAPASAPSAPAPAAVTQPL